MTLAQSLATLANDALGLSMKVGRIAADAEIARQAEEAIEVYRIRVDELKLFTVAES